MGCVAQCRVHLVAEDNSGRIIGVFKDLDRAVDRGIQYLKSIHPEINPVQYPFLGLGEISLWDPVYPRYKVSVTRRDVY